MKVTVHYWKTDGIQQSLTLETEEDEQWTKDKAVEVVPQTTEIEHVEVHG